MKTFLSSFAICFILCAAFLFFGGIRLLQNIWAVVALFSLIIAIGISLFAEQESRIEALEQRLQALEQAIHNNETEEPL